MNRKMKKIHEDYAFRKICLREGCKNMTEEEIRYMNNTLWLGANGGGYINVYSLKNLLEDYNFNKTIKFYLYNNNVLLNLKKLYKELMRYIKI